LGVHITRPVESWIRRAGPLHKHGIAGTWSHAGSPCFR
jgi:hypothetical protein